MEKLDYHNKRYWNSGTNERLTASIFTLIERVFK